LQKNRLEVAFLPKKPSFLGFQKNKTFFFENAW
jgi:hypothetical protein